jgi:sugar diacid utilization regulator/putative methionine-R-sulfoxide reductase with GAF domain
MNDDENRVHHALTELLRRLLTARTVSAAAQATVDTVREALDADISWCGIVNGDFLTMAAYNGIRTAEMMAIWRLKVGQGVGGRVAQEGKTLSVRDYRRDPRRVPVMKSVIDEEGVRSALCAPMVSGADILGVVYAAQRETRDWSSNDIQMITDIGRDAGVVLGQIKQRHSEQEQAERADREVALARRAIDVLLKIATAVGGTDDIAAGIDTFAHHLGMQVELLDPGGDVLRIAPGTAGEDEPVQWEGAIADETLGSMRIRGQDQLGAGDRAVADIGARIIGLQLMRRRAALRAEVRLHGELLHDLLEGRLEDMRGIRDRAMLLGIDLKVPRFVACIGWHHATQGTRHTVTRRALTAAETAIHGRFPESLIIPQQDKIVILLAPGDAGLDEVHAELQRAVRHSYPPEPGLAAGVGRMCLGPADYADSYGEASLGLDVARRRPQPAEVLTQADLGLYGLVARGTGRESLETMVENALGPLQEADADSGSEYVKTLHAYLVCDRHLERTAASLHVHPNTVRYRLAKAQEKLGIDLRDVENRFLLELALRVQDALRKPGTPRQS